MKYTDIVKELISTTYRIYSIKRSGRLLNFWTLRVPGFIRDGRLFKAGLLLDFHHFLQVVSLFCKKTIKITKREDVPKLNFNCSLKVSVKY